MCEAEGSARPLFPQWSHHVYPQFLPGSHPNASAHHNYVRHRHSYVKHHYNHNNNHHSHHYNHKVDHRYHRNSIASHTGNPQRHGNICIFCWWRLIFWNVVWCIYFTEIFFGGSIETIFLLRLIVCVPYIEFNLV